MKRTFVSLVLLVLIAMAAPAQSSPAAAPATSTSPANPLANATEIEDSKKQLNVQGDKMSPDAHEALVKSIEAKQKTLQRNAEDAQNEFQQQQNEIASRILQKMAPVITKYVADNGYGLLVDSSSPWPQGPVVLFTPPMDITKQVVDAYNAVSGVPAPARSGASSTGAASKPAGTAMTPAAKPATAAPATTTPKPTTTTPPKQ